jgi:hypothetical protein
MNVFLSPGETSPNEPSASTSPFSPSSSPSHSPPSQHPPYNDRPSFEDLSMNASMGIDASESPLSFEARD